METLLDKHWHHLPWDQVADLLDVDADNGLDSFDSARRLDHFGPNTITGKRQKTRLERFLLQFHQPLVYILLAAGGVTLLLGEYIDAGVILGVVLVNALVGYSQEAKAVRELSALARSMRLAATVVRAGEARTLDASEIVPGDLVLLRSGDKVPADVRLVSTRELRVDESALTGESLPVSKGEDMAPHDAVLAERTCMAYAGTLVSYGQGRGIVVATGNKTELGRISGLVDAAGDLETPLTRKIGSFSHVLLVAILVLAALCFGLGVMRGERAADMFMAAVALAVGAIPEGLPAAVTVILALGVSRMAGRKAIIRKLPAVETLGGTTVICSDKTGTLTENRMMVTDIHCGGERFIVQKPGETGNGGLSGESGGPVDPAANEGLLQCLRAGLLCNDARIHGHGPDGEAEGDPTEVALLVSAAMGGLSGEEERGKAPRIDDLPFESDVQYMATLHQVGDTRVVYVKGAVEKVLDCCDRAVGLDGAPGGLDHGMVAEAQNAMASRGLRVLALAMGTLEEGTGLDHEAIASGMVFLGLQGMIDPPRKGVAEAIAACRMAGVDVKMITGDHAVTAQAIGEALNLCGGGADGGSSCIAMTGREIAELDDEGLTGRVEEVSVFARVSPEQKLRLVMALQAKGHVCAMTGDGVNDAPSLKQADIGIAMGVGGTEAAKEASDMVLTDDNFATIEAAVEEGRGVFDNLMKFIAWTLPTNAGEGLVILAAILFGVALPILPVQILWINMTTAGLLGMMLAFEPKEPGIMEVPPREPDKPLLDGIMVRRVVMVSLLLLVGAFGLFEWEVMAGGDVDKARTMAVNVFVVVEAFYLFNARSFTRSPWELGLGSNPWVPAGAVFMLALQAAYTYLPFMNTVFSSAPLGWLDWIKIAVCGGVVFLLVEVDKKIVRRGRMKRKATAA